LAEAVFALFALVDLACFEADFFAEVDVLGCDSVIAVVVDGVVEVPALAVFDVSVDPV